MQMEYEEEPEETSDIKEHMIQPAPHRQASDDTIVKLSSWKIMFREIQYHLKQTFADNKQLLFGKESNFQGQSLQQQATRCKGDSLLSTATGHNQRKLQARQLYNHPDFRLLYVPADNESTMRIVQPTKDLEHQQRLEMNGYYALSHIWGDIQRDPLWDVSGLITDEHGHPAQPVPMRLEKRDTLLALLKPGSYWWIDVLCARSDTPLMIMGDIYEWCNRCFALIDVSPAISGNEHINAKWLTLSIMVTNTLRAYRHAIKHNDIDQFENYCSTATEATGDVEKPLRLEELATQFHDELHAVAQFFDCFWFTRVWTWQEFLLPERFTAIDEQCDTVRFHASTFVYLDQIIWSLQKIYKMIESQAILKEEYRGGITQIISENYTRFHHIIEQQRTIKVDLQLWKSSKARFIGLKSMLDNLAGSPRTCTNPVDYVYGVLGLLAIDVPRMSDPHAVWSTFLSVLSQRLQSVERNDPDFFASVSETAHSFDLSKAKNLGHVYHGLVIFTRKTSKHYTRMGE
ncbi:hypothetical protein K492DRAFT_209362 [Lichtheimia hyalospora FSU 10163]|nr:hypothetical protein K492DRAFT_209362 [Lichtheimia hyalospora FSU 10163]